ncbi:hypothetical protein [Pseudomonas sp. NW5]|nr:hypothetical protein [Pseudomonas sp. NW5]MCL7462114.1 hypothetical protein [Pseudomonas sp. NW5]
MALINKVLSAAALAVASILGTTAVQAETLRMGHMRAAQPCLASGG